MTDQLRAVDAVLLPVATKSPNLQYVANQIKPSVDVSVSGHFVLEPFTTLLLHRVPLEHATILPIQPQQHVAMLQALIFGLYVLQDILHVHLTHFTLVVPLEQFAPLPN